jgi:hypothetical protein
MSMSFGFGVDVSEDRLLTLKEAAALIPSRRGGRPTSESTLRNWAVRGYRGGRRLSYVKVGASLCTTAAWVREFLVGLTEDEEARHAGARAGATVAVAAASPTRANTAAHRAAEKIAAAKGF